LPQLRVYNKVDLLADTEPHIDRDDSGKPFAVWLSAQTGVGCNLLEEAISELLGKEVVNGRLVLTPQQGRLRAMLYTQQAVVTETYRDDGTALVQIRIPKSDLLRILSAESMTFEQLVWAEDMTAAQDSPGQL